MHLETDLYHDCQEDSIINDISADGLAAGLAAVLDELIEVNHFDYPNKHIKSRILLLEFLEAIFTHNGLVTPSISGKTETQRDILQYIQQNYRGSLSLQDLADHFHMSPKYISRYFKLHFDLTFSQYVRHLRIIHAKKLLDTTAIPITEIALCSGFSSVSYFIRSFKEYYGIPPFRYRKQDSI